MRIIDLYVSVLNIKRVFQIIWIVNKHLFAELSNRHYFSLSIKRRVRHTTYSTPQRLRQTIEELGPTYVKFGQIVADRPDIVSEKFRSELKKLQSNVGVFDTNIAITLIETELGESITSVFKSFDLTPWAAASIGQVYRATLKNNQEVVIKIQRPFIENKIKLDIYLMKFLSAKLAKNYPEMAAINIVGLVNEFSDNIIHELDYRIEANNIKIFDNMFVDMPQIKIPKLYDKYTTKRLLITEFISGITPDSRDVLLENGFDCNEIIKNGSEALFTMIFHNGIFHADPHPGNLFVMKNNVVAFIDFGMVGILRPKDINFLADFIVGFYKKDNTLITKSLLTLCSKQYFEKEDELAFDVRQMLIQNYSSKVVDLKNFSKIMQSSIDILIKHSLQIPTGIFMLIKVLATLEKFAHDIAPDTNMANIVMPYAKDIISKRYSPRKIAYDIYESLKKYVELVQSLPGDVGEILYKLKEGKIKHDIKLNDEYLFTTTVRRMTLRLAYVIMLIGLFVGATILIVWDNDQRFGYFILYFSSVLILFLLLKWLFTKDK